MYCLAVEQSTPTGSCALLAGDTVLATRSWDNATRRGQPLFEALPAIFAETGVAAAAVEHFAVGLGPGRFSSLRVSLAAVKGLALPGHRPVYGVSSGEVLAQELFEQTEAHSITVIGDARRHRLWMAVFESRGDDIVETTPYTLIPADDFPARVTPDTWIVSPDWDRLAEAVDAMALPTKTVLREVCHPGAVALAACVRRHLETDRASEAVSPIYMHPPVFVKPRFPSRPA